jgi:serine protease Do
MIKLLHSRNISNFIFSLFNPKVKNLPSSTPNLLPEEIIEKSSPSVFSIYGESSTQCKFGTGFFISPEGKALTANHVIENNTNLLAQLDSGLEFSFKVLEKNCELDIALLKFDLPTRVPFLSLGNSSLCRKGQQVLTLGSPNQDTFKEFFISYISSVNHFRLSGEEGKKTEDFSMEEHRKFFVLTQGALRKGFSGAPLISFKGDVLGLHIQNIKRVKKDHSLDEAAFVPSNVLKMFVDEKTQIYSKFHDFGISFEELHFGLLVMQVENKSPAEIAGIAVGDVVVGVNGKDVKKYTDFVAAVTLENTEKIDLKVKRISSFSNFTLYPSPRN